MDQRLTETEQVAPQTKSLEALLTKERRWSAQLMDELVAARRTMATGTDAQSAGPLDQQRIAQLVQRLEETERIATQLRDVQSALARTRGLPVHKDKDEAATEVEPSITLLRDLQALLPKEREWSAELMEELRAVRQALASARTEPATPPANTEPTVKSEPPIARVEPTLATMHATDRHTDRRMGNHQPRHQAPKRSNMTYTLSLDRPLITKAVLGLSLVGILLFLCGLLVGLALCGSGDQTQASFHGAQVAVVYPAASPLSGQDLERNLHAPDSPQTAFEGVGTFPPRHIPR